MSNYNRHVGVKVYGEKRQILEEKFKSLAVNVRQALDFKVGSQTAREIRCYAVNHLKCPVILEKRIIFNN